MQQILDYAKENGTPIIEPDGLEFLTAQVSMLKPLRILEIGTAIGFSSINMYLASGAEIVTLERNEVMFAEANKNIERFGLADKITAVLTDALEFDPKPYGTFDLIYIDAAKAQNIKFFEKYIPFLNEGGTVMVDNLNFHEVRENPELALTRNVRQLIRKIEAFITYMNENPDYVMELHNVGDGIGVITKRS